MSIRAAHTTARLDAFDNDNDDVSARIQKMMSGIGASSSAPGDGPSAADIYAKDPELESLVQDFAGRMAMFAGQRQQQPPADSIAVQPLPGFVIKTRSAEACLGLPSGTKVFVNFCRSPDVPQPIHITDNDIDDALALQADPNTSAEQAANCAPFRIPMGISPPRMDKSKKGEPCIVCDAVVHTNVIDRAMTNDKFRSFLCSLSMGYMAHKHSLATSDECILLNIPAKGALMPQTIRTRRNPVISEVNPSPPTPAGRLDIGSKSKRIENKGPHRDITTVEPAYNITFKPSPQDPRWLVVDVNMPATSIAERIDLDVEAERLLLEAGPRYKLDLALPVPIDIDMSSAKFNPSKRVLTVTMNLLKV